LEVNVGREEVMIRNLSKEAINLKVYGENYQIQAESVGQFFSEKV